MDENKYLDSLFQELLQQKKIKIAIDKKWLKEIKKTAGVYLININGVIKYVGETGNLHKRMKDLLKTYNHTFRRSLGKHLYEKNKDYHKERRKNKFTFLACLFCR